MKHSVLVIFLLSTTLIACTGLNTQPAAKKEILIFGASGRIGGQLTDEALLRGYLVTGVSRNPEELQLKFPQIEAVKGDILDRDNLESLLTGQETVLISVGGKPTSPDAEKYIAYTAAVSLIDVLSEMGSSGPRIIFVGNVFTLSTENGEPMLERGKDSPNYPMFKGHQLALDAFRESQNINWSIASPPNGFRLKGRTQKVRYGTDTLLLDAEGKPASISLADYAYGIFEEIDDENYLSRRFTLAR